MNFLKGICFFIVMLLVVGSFAFAGEPLTRSGDKSDLPPGVSGDWWTTVQQNIQKEEYNLSQALGEKKALYQAPNRAQGFRSFFSEKGVRLVPRTEEKPSWEWGLELVQEAEGGRLKAEVSATDNRIEIVRGNITEWYVNDENGLEQGFTVQKPIEEGGKLHIDMKLTGSLRPKFAEDGQAVDFYDNGNVSVIHYAKLKVTDAAGRELSARFEGVPGAVRIAVDAEGASYPVTIDPLAMSPAWTAEGDQADAEFGVSVGTAGDVNGDGYSDVIVGAPYYDNGQEDEGRAYVYLGGPSGPSASPAWTAEGDQEYAFFGYSVGTAGDVNGDGYSDVIVGAILYDNGQTDEGRAYVYLGGPAGPAASAGWTAESDQDSAWFGYSVGTAGDVNGDGYSDVIVGTPLYDNGQTDEGRAYVYLGGPSGLSASAAWTAEGDQAHANFGFSVGTAGDVNGDGYSDVIVGAIYYTNGQTDEGRAYVYLGGPSGLAVSPAWTAESNQAGALFGISVGTAGDVNGDGYSDVIVGAIYYTNGQDYEGRAYVYLGGPSGLSAAEGWTAESNQDYANFGQSVGTAGDVNGDGYSDIIVGAYRYDNGQTDEGQAYIYLGGSSGLAVSAAWTAESNQADAQFGVSVGAAGDVNGDGYSDVIVGAYGYDNGQTDEGRAYVYLGGPSGPLASAAWTAESDQAGAEFGLSVGTVGDVNGDGYSDVIVGALSFDNGQADEGRAYVYLGGPAGLSASAAWTAEGNQADAYFGRSVGTVGDVNGDGFSDIIVGAYGYDNGQENEGRVYVYFGNGEAGGGLALKPQQRRADDAAPVDKLGKSESRSSFRIASLGRTPFGRGEVRLETEVKPLGSLFDGLGTQIGSPWTDSGTSGAALSELTASLSSGTTYHWRARLHYSPATTPFQQRSRWFTQPWGGWNETDLRMARAADLGVTQTDIDPVLAGGDATYTVTVGNSGPDPAVVVLEDTIPAGSTFVSATPSQGSCSQAGGVVTCGLGGIAPGGSATVSVMVTAGAAGSCTNHAGVSTASAEDGNPSNDASDEATTVLAPAIGNLVWGDADGDGVQDPGENGMQNIPVGLYDAAGNFLSATITDASGAYHFTGLAYGQTYRVQVFPPSGYTTSPRDQGSDDMLDSDVDVATGQTPIFALTDGLDPSRWDAGLVYGIACEPPDEPVWIYLVTLSDPDEYPILNFQDPNQPTQRTGYNVRRSDDPSVVPKSSWPIVCSNCVDMDAATPNYQWTDTSGDTPSGGVWYYLVTAYNAYCPAEGPFSNE